MKKEKQFTDKIVNNKKLMERYKITYEIFTDEEGQDWYGFLIQDPNILRHNQFKQN